MVIRYRTDYCDSERFLRFTQAQTRRTTDVGESLQTAGDVEVFLHNTSGVKRRRRSLASLYINQYWRTVGAVTDTDNVEGSTIALSDVRLLIGLLYSQFIYNAKVVQLISFKHVVIDKAEASFDKIALFGASLQRKMFPEETGNLDRTTRYTCVPNLVLCELASAHHTREIGQFLHDHNNGVNGITITELLEFVKRCKRVSLHLFTAMGATVACYSPQVKAGTTVHSIIGLISDDHVLRFVNESDRKSILKSGTVLPGMLGRQIWDTNYLDSVEIATTATAVRESTAKVVLIDIAHFSMCELIHDTILEEGRYVEDIRFSKESGIQAFRLPSDAGQVYEISTDVQVRHDLYDRLAESTCDKLRFGHWANDSWAVMAGNVYEVLYSHSFKSLQRDMGLDN
ncbi:hypothetical protein B484DRAFT_401246 [Ochromonadaceae sp. CCMP2298]|nr:hypothetical protein B484DRAFT_401246 [Ochromonadaceae sp. CCMP2298]